MREKIHESEYGGSPKNFHVTKCGDELHVELTYPPYTDADNAAGQCRYIVVDQESVRASDGLRLYYDFDRDGFVVQQASTFEWEADDAKCDPDWQEVGFFKSWARERSVSLKESDKP